MSRNSSSAKFLRCLGIVLMGLTGGFTLLGGIGTGCVALFPKNYETMAGLATLQWLYILFVLAGIVLGVWGIRTTIHLVRGAPKAYLASLKVLVAGVIVGFIHIFASRSLRGASMPVDAVVYTTALTLIIFLLFRIPGIWQSVNFEKSSIKSNKPAGGAAAILLGLMTLTIQYTMGSTHTWGGVNFANAFNTSMTLAGLSLVTLGCGLLIRWDRLLDRGKESRVQMRSA